jgi:hypothetical protein
MSDLTPGLLACPQCGLMGKVKLQTPAESDGMVRRCYFRCFGCGHLSPNYPHWVTCHWKDSGKAAYPPLREFWNKYAQDVQGSGAVAFCGVVHVEDAEDILTVAKKIVHARTVDARFVGGHWSSQAGQ